MSTITIAPTTTLSTAPETTELVPGFEVRPLGPEHLDVVKALSNHSMMFESPIWSKIIPLSEQTKHVYRLFEIMGPWAMHGLKSGHSYGLFDTNYVYKRPESAAAPGGGKLYWDFDNLSATKEELLQQLDSPLVSVALAYDGFDKFDHARLCPTENWFPGVTGIMKLLVERDTRDPASWEPTAHGQVMFRNSTQTRSDYQGHGLMKALSHFLMRQAKKEGFRAIKIECFNEILPRVWLNPPAPFRAVLVSQAHTSEVEEVGEDGETVFPIRGAPQKVSRIHVDLL
ncbi:hypothetical protein GGS23DRAFT_546843 [Durotheca rogersii]|uniref:uncharacterized protein n=1 Tax=Durotheca rogersii TaxID=419775 RepID=UPI0022200C8E|nr:uncharacterized protein GGS23DRAFT_546843 [Durotheca rogersii]KAI5868706.1 hypothetical protein GGS23DRAFT_546843 [Durotheca rogersii]